MTSKTDKAPAKKPEPIKEAPKARQVFTAEDCERLGIDPTPYGHAKA